MSLKEQNAMVVFSGGQDSTTCLFWAQENFAAVEAITFDYSQRHSAELDYARNICLDLGVPQTVLDMSLLGQLTANALTRDTIAVPTGAPDGVPSTFVDGRNLLFLSFAAVVAKQKGIRHLVTGVCETDFSGYPDCRDVFVKSLNTTLNLAMDYPFVIHTPLMWLDKAGVWELSDTMGRLDYVRANTLICYNGIAGAGCAECPACLLRAAGLEKYLAKRRNI